MVFLCFSIDFDGNGGFDQLGLRFGAALPFLFFSKIPDLFRKNAAFADLQMIFEHNGLICY